MNVGFYLTSHAPSYVYADALVRSVRSTMPHVPIHQFTDMKSPSVWGIDATHRLPPAPLSVLRSAHYAAVSGEWLFLDADCIVQRDVQEVFNFPFDIAVTDRHWPHLSPLPEAYTEAMPYCAGVVFSRSQRFWEEVHRRVHVMSVEDQGWIGDQRAMCDVLAAGYFNRKVLDGYIYQFPPGADDIMVSELPEAAIVHYKGPERKKLLMSRIHRELELVR